GRGDSSRPALGEEHIRGRSTSGGGAHQRCRAVALSPALSAALDDVGSVLQQRIAPPPLLAGIGPAHLKSWPSSAPPVLRVGRLSVNQRSRSARGRPVRASSWLISSGDGHRAAGPSSFAGGRARPSGGPTLGGGATMGGGPWSGGLLLGLWIPLSCRVWSCCLLWPAWHPGVPPPIFLVPMELRSACSRLSRSARRSRNQLLISWRERRVAAARVSRSPCDGKLFLRKFSSRTFSCSAVLPFMRSSRGNWVGTGAFCRAACCWPPGACSTLRSRGPDRGLRALSPRGGGGCCSFRLWLQEGGGGARARAGLRGGWMMLGLLVLWAGPRAPGGLPAPGASRAWVMGCFSFDVSEEE
ncbi:LOW QUALITY PROTEIN: hypothetical protein CRUP_002663, partial [Coryphaenoides rupestris]